MLSWSTKCSSRWRCSSTMLGLLLLTATIFLFCSQQPLRVELMPTNANFTPADLLLFNKTREKYFLVFLIPSHPKHVDVRKTIRQTWMNVSGWNDLASVGEHYKRIKVLFLFGSYSDEGNFDQEFYDELKDNDDMYQISDLREHRTALKYKVMWGMKQALYWYDFDYIAKTDDDIVVNLPTMISDLIPLPRDRYYTGNCKMPYGGFRGFPRWMYCSGGGYVLSRDVVSKFQELPSSVHHAPFRPEDAYTGYLVNRARELLGYRVHIVPARRVNLWPYKCGPFVHWFYHYCNTARQHVHLYEKIRSNSSNLC